MRYALLLVGLFAGAAITLTVVNANAPAPKLETVVQAEGDEYLRAMRRLRDIQMDRYERQHGRAARVRYEASFKGPGWNLRYDVPGWTVVK